MIDLALPGNDIPRVFFNTGIEYRLIVDFVKEKQKEDSRFVIAPPQINISKMLKEYGYPFKSKEFAQILRRYQTKGKMKTVTNYLGETGNKLPRFQCPKVLKGCFTEEFPLKVSDLCCTMMKKNPSKHWGKTNGKPIAITGIRMEEGGARSTIKGCTAFNKDKSLKKFHPLFPVTDSFITEFIDEYNVEICKIYQKPYNFKRTGCKGCPFNVNLKKDLETLEKLLPEEKKQCELIWKPVYDIYRNLHFRL